MPKTKSTSPTQRTLADMRKLGAVCAITEHWNSYVKQRVDLFGFIDLIALLGPNCIAIQVTSGTNHSARRTKILTDPKAAPKARAWLEAGNLIEIHSWSMKGARGARKLWECRREEIILSDFPVEVPAEGEMF